VRHKTGRPAGGSGGIDGTGNDERLGLKMSTMMRPNMMSSSKKMHFRLQCSLISGKLSRL
jgi:hypothetical protein